MTGNIVPLQREHAKRVFNTEWSHQLATIEQSVNFFEEHFLWSTGLLREVQGAKSGDSSAASYEYTAFYEAEAPIVLKEVREAIQILRLLCRSEPDETSGSAEVFNNPS